jgi:hypothetical protein
MKIWSFKSLLFVASLGLFITSCTDDGGGSTVDQGPTVSLESGSGLFSTDTSIIFGQEFTVSVKGAKTSNDLKTITVEEAGVKLALDRIVSGINANPALLLSTDATSFTKNIKIKAHTTLGEKTYSFIVEDVNGNKTSKSIKITTKGTSVTMLTGILLNQAGMVGTGGLDLDKGIGTGSADSTAEIRDMGIDLGLPLASNWKQRVAGVNGTEIKAIKKGQNGIPETFSFASITIKEDLVSLYNQGIEFTATDGALKVSDKISLGDIFIVKKGNTYYIIETKDVNIVNNGNTDSYTFDVKF